VAVEGRLALNFLVFKEISPMQARNRRTGYLAVLAAVLLFSMATPSLYAAVTTQTGTFADGATFLIEVPSPWNGTLLLYSHGYVGPGSSNPAQDVGDPLTRAFLLANGFALAGSSYAHTGWAIQEALVDQVAVLDTFNAMFGKPKRTIAWGHSLGGIITAGLIQRNPHLFDAALPMCGVLSGGVGTWNEALDGAFAFKTLFSFGGPLQVGEHNQSDRKPCLGRVAAGRGPGDSSRTRPDCAGSGVGRHPWLVRSRVTRAGGE
jgi:hypothetical protein